MSYSEEWAKYQLDQAKKRTRFTNLACGTAVILGCSFMVYGTFLLTGLFRGLVTMVSTSPQYYSGIPLQATMPSELHYYTLTPPPELEPVILTPVPAIKSKVTKIPLYGLSLNLPTGWKLLEVNRRPEPLQEQINHHDCANYVLLSPDERARLILVSTCGDSEGIGDRCPQNTSRISPTITRYYDDSKSIYVYTNSGMANISHDGITEKQYYCIYSPSIGYETEKGSAIFAATFMVQDAVIDSASLIAVADGIILSIKPEQ